MCQLSLGSKEETDGKIQEKKEQRVKQCDDCFGSNELQSSFSGKDKPQDINQKQPKKEVAVHVKT